MLVSEARSLGCIGNPRVFTCVAVDEPIALPDMCEATSRGESNIAGALRSSSCVAFPEMMVRRTGRLLDIYAVRSTAPRRTASQAGCLGAAASVKRATWSTTRDCCSAFSCGYIGSDTISRATLSQTGKSPSR